MAEQSKTPKIIHAAQKLWDQGRRDDAIRHLIEIINRTPQALPRNACLQLAYFLFQGTQFRSAETILSAYLKQNPQDFEALENRGVLRLRMGRLEEAHQDLQQVANHRPQSVNAWDALTAALARLGRTEEAQNSGSKVLTLKDQQCQQSKSVDIQWPENTPQEWDVQHQERTDIISFSLWGSQPIYLRGAVRNLLDTPKLYPGWQCRFYIDSSVPAEFSELATSLGGQVVEELPGQPMRQKLSWRFQVAGDPTVRRFLVRDADSVISEREVHAVQNWLESDRWFHVMRDWWTHTDLILAGMWGGRAGLLEPLLPKLGDYQSGRLETANIDQWFLRDCVWSSIRESCLIHDRYFRALNSVPWPDPTPEGNFHVGQAVRPERQTDNLKPLIEKYEWLQLPQKTPQA